MQYTELQKMRILAATPQHGVSIAQIVAALIICVGKGKVIVIVMLIALEVSFAEIITAEGTFRQRVVAGLQLLTAV